MSRIVILCPSGVKFTIRYRRRVAARHTCQSQNAIVKFRIPSTEQEDDGNLRNLLGGETFKYGEGALLFLHKFKWVVR